MSARWVGLFYVLSLLILIGAEIFIEVPYVDPRLPRAVLPFELALTAVFLVATRWVFDRESLGLVRPRIAKPQELLPLVALVFAAGFAWLGVAVLSDSATRYPGLWRWTFASTLFVGFTEEWMYRGLLFAFFSSHLGLRQGAFFAILAFGLLHALNIVAGVPAHQAAFQVVLTSLAGAIFLRAALATRSLLFPILGHALYDFFLIDMRRFETETPSSLWSALPLIVLIVMGGLSVFRLSRMERHPEPPAQ